MKLAELNVEFYTDQVRCEISMTEICSCFDSLLPMLESVVLNRYGHEFRIKLDEEFASGFSLNKAMAVVKFSE